MKISKKNIVKLFVVFLSSWNQGANPISACTSWPFLTDKGFDICDVKPNRVVGGKINDRLEACNLRPYCPCGNVTVFMRTILLTVLNLKVLFILVYLFTLSGDTPDTDLTQQRLFFSTKIFSFIDTTRQVWLYFRLWHNAILGSWAHHRKKPHAKYTTRKLQQHFCISFLLLGTGLKGNCFCLSWGYVISMWIKWKYKC